jgi:hypothetical protein
MVKEQTSIQLLYRLRFIELVVNEVKPWEFEVTVLD